MISILLTVLLTSKEPGDMKCHNSNLNGRYLAGKYSTYVDGVVWKDFRGLDCSLKVSEMKIRRN